MSKIIYSPKSKRHYTSKGHSFTATIKAATRYRSYDEAEEAMEDAGLLGKRGAFTIKDSPETVVELKKAARLAKKGGKAGKATTKASSIVQNPDGSSFGIMFTRKAGRSAKLGIRRFRTEKEAQHHGTRVSDKAGYAAFRAVKQHGSPVNSWVNWTSGLSNPGLKTLKGKLAAPVTA
jgi:hypothetical protein